MAIILFHTNTDIPQHLLHCVEKIRQYSKIPIYFLTDSNSHIDDIIHISIAKYDKFNWLNELNYFRGNDHLSKMWRSSCFRMFYIQEFLKDKQLKNVLHFDNDVLLYEKPEKIIELMDSLYDNFAITPHNSDEVVMGMSYIKNENSIDGLVSFIENELKIDSHILSNKYNGYPSEMRLISAYNKIEMIPILPTNLSENRYTNNYYKFKSVFDPSSYGQYIGGTYSDKKPGWFGVHQEIGKFIANNDIEVIFEDRNPYLIFKEQKIKINNLHIHSKQTEKYL
jgi:hypothetical protein